MGTLGRSSLLLLRANRARWSGARHSTGSVGSPVSRVFGFVGVGRTRKRLLATRPLHRFKEANNSLAAQRVGKVVGGVGGIVGGAVGGAAGAITGGLHGLGRGLYSTGSGIVLPVNR
jgi:hypothetical protein